MPVGSLRGRQTSGQFVGPTLRLRAGSLSTYYPLVWRDIVHASKGFSLRAKMERVIKKLLSKFELSGVLLGRLGPC
jgi:hypothetical protein